MPSRTTEDVVSRAWFTKYARAVAKALRAHVPTYQDGDGWWYHMAIMSVPFGKHTFWVRIGSDPYGNAVSYVASWEAALAKRFGWAATRKHSIEWIEGEHPVPKPGVLGATLRTILRGAAEFEDASRPPRRASRRR